MSSVPRTLRGGAACARMDLAEAELGKAPSPPIVFTVDVEDYFQVAAFRSIVRPEDWVYYPSRVEDNVSRLLDLCDEHGVRGTWFVLGWEAAQRPHMVRRIVERGHEVGCHSYWHRPVFELTPRAFRDDTLLAKDTIEQAGGTEVTGYRAPSFSIRHDSSWAFAVLADLGFRYDSSVFPVLHPQYGIPDAPPHPYLVQTKSGPFWELPPATAPAFGRRWPVAGGGYLRQLPAVFCRWGVAHLRDREGHAAVLYVHPWEIDPDQPRLRAGWVTRLRHYRNLRGMTSRLTSILRWGPFETASDRIRVLHRAPEPAWSESAVPVRTIA